MSLVLPKTTGQVIVDEVAKALSSINPIQSNWDYVGFDNGGVSVGTPGIEISVGLSGGVLKVKEKGKSSPNRIVCGSLDGGVGLTPAPFNVTFPLPNMPGKGIIFKLPCLGNDQLCLNSFRGGFVMINGAAQCGLTGNLNFMFFGAKIFPTAGSCISYIPKMVLASPVLIVSVSMAGALVPDIGVTASVGVAV